MARQLAKKIANRIDELCSVGDDLADSEQYDQAIDKYEEALALLPEPAADWEAATWLLTAIGETCFFVGEHASALRALQDCMHCPGAIGNPYIHLRLGQVQFELGNLDRAADELARAYMGGDEDVFEGEDNKYLDFVKPLLRPAAKKS